MYNQAWIVLIVVIFNSAEFVSNEDGTNDVIVKVDQGFLRGKEQITSLDHTKYFAFTGIPYAKPPIGPLRFKDPIPGEPWNGTFNATNETSECPQQLGTKDVTGNEDCLYLNVYTPQFSVEQNSRYPVLIFIHGGGFMTGEASQASFGPDYLIVHNIVIVTFYYRLGVLGFLCSLTENAPGNAGLKDQLLAIKWVSQNIHSFGGDPDNVTILGSSAGSASVHYHMLSPASKGLFHRGILNSGTALNSWSFTTDPVDRLFRYGQMLGFSGTDVDELVDYLRNTSVNDLIKKQNSMYNEQDEKECLQLPFIPTIEKEGTSNITFMPNNPKTLMESGNFTKVPVIISTCTNEGAAVLPASFITTKSYDHDYGRIVPVKMHLKNDSPAFNQLCEEIGEFYFNNETIDVFHVDQYIKACADVLSTNSLNESITYFLKSNTTVYLYLFEYEGQLGPVSFLLKNTRPDLKGLSSVKGPFHTDDLGYVFRNNIFDKVDIDSDDMKQIRQMTSFFANFIINGNPNGQNNGPVEWEPSKQNNIKYLEIVENITMINHMYLTERLEFWKEAFNKYQ